MPADVASSSSEPAELSQLLESAKLEDALVKVSLRTVDAFDAAVRMGEEEDENGSDGDHE